MKGSHRSACEQKEPERTVDSIAIEGEYKDGGMQAVGGVGKQNELESAVNPITDVEVKSEDQQIENHEECRTEDFERRVQASLEESIRAARARLAQATLRNNGCEYKAPRKVGGFPLSVRGP